MIFTAAGTQDGRELAGALLSAGYPVTASVVSSYGEKLLERYPGLVVNDKPLDAEALEAYIREHGVRLFVDASHPYAANVSQNAMRACHAEGIPYIRYERRSVPIDYENVHRVETYEEAAKAAAQFGKTVFLTTGSRNLKAFVKSEALKEHTVIARILPTAKVLEECEVLGLTPKQIVALQGPFSEELNVALYQQYGAEVIVTKNSGEIGGTDTKLTAAKKLGLSVVMIDRPKLEYDVIAYTFEEVLEFVKLKLGGK
ncbi:MAG: cobalt-precorrin-6A reductase [Selenomonadaceae bacterium]|nr:cobalt-precorrin-6A reductase [Selenomonadaceae bacterium]